MRTVLMERLSDELKLFINEMDVIWIPFTSIKVNIDRPTIGYLPKGGTWHWITPIEAEDIIKGFNLNQYSDGSWYISCSSTDYTTIYSDKWKAGNMTLFGKWCKRMKEGDTLERFKEISRTVKLENHTNRQLNAVDKVVTRISIPDVYRSADNPKKRTFDYVRVECNLRTTFEGNRSQYIKEHIKEITRAVLDKVGANKRYQIYGVPVNFLKVSYARIMGDVLVYGFEIKDKPALIKKEGEK